jgi:hypothetical protein
MDEGLFPDCRRQDDGYGCEIYSATVPTGLTAHWVLMANG